MDIQQLPKSKIERIIGETYIYNSKIVIWDGKQLKCEHGRVKSYCKECSGSQFCEHGIRKSYCKECGGSEICEHGRRKSKCKECGGSGICKHGRRKSRCKECGGSEICEHGKHKTHCKECHPNGYLISRMRNRVYKALRKYSTRKDKKHTMEYVGCSLEVLRSHLEAKFVDGMSWDRQGEWHIDHIKPCASFNLDSEEERNKCFHYTNLQPLWGADNLSKSDFYDENEEDQKWDGDQWIFN